MNPAFFISLLVQGLKFDISDVHKPGVTMLFARRKRLHVGALSGNQPTF